MSLINRAIDLMLSLTANGTTKDVVAVNTPPQFDNTKQLATMEAVQRALGSYSSAEARYGAQTLTNADFGKHLVAGNDTVGRTWSLPQNDGLPNGAAIKITNLSGFVVTLQRFDGDDKFIGAHKPDGTATTFAIVNGATVILEKYGANMWLVTGSADESFGAMWSRSLVTAGYQKLPGGLIIQWGQVPSVAGNGSQTVAYPIPFPSACFAVVATAGADNIGKVPLSGVNATLANTTAFIAYNSSASIATQPGLYIAIGA